MWLGSILCAMLVKGLQMSAGNSKKSVIGLLLEMKFGVKMRGLLFQIWLDSTGSRSWLRKWALLAFHPGAHSAIRSDGKAEMIHTQYRHTRELKPSSWWQTRPQVKRGLALGQSFPKVDVHSGELPLSRESPESGWLPTGVCGKGRWWIFILVT